MSKKIKKVWAVFQGEGDTTTLTQAKKWLRENSDEGCRCPACGQVVKMYRHKFTSQMAVFILWLYYNGHHQSHHYIKFLDKYPRFRSKQYSLARHWDLIEKDEIKGPGWWKLTRRGVLMIREGLKINKYAIVYNGAQRGYSGPMIGIRQALGNKFNLDELLSKSD